MCCVLLQGQGETMESVVRLYDVGRLRAEEEDQEEEEEDRNEEEEDTDNSDDGDMDQDDDCESNTLLIIRYRHCIES